MYAPADTALQKMRSAIASHRAKARERLDSALQTISTFSGVFSEFHSDTGHVFVHAERSKDGHAVSLVVEIPWNSEVHRLASFQLSADAVGDITLTHQYKPIGGKPSVSSYTYPSGTTDDSARQLAIAFIESVEKHIS